MSLYCPVTNVSFIGSDVDIEYSMSHESCDSPYLEEVHRRLGRVWGLDSEIATRLV